MSVYFPQLCATVRVLWEDFNLKTQASKLVAYSATVQVKSCTVNVNDYKAADTFDMELDYKSFPFDPRAIRSMAVTIHLEDLKKLVDPSTGQHTVIKPTEENIIFTGYADEETITFSESSRTVKISGRDFTALLLDQKYLRGSPITLNQPIDVVIKNILNAFPESGAAVLAQKVVNKTNSKVLPTLAQYHPDFGQKLAGQKTAGKHETVWEIIQDIVSKAGLICYVHLDQLIISEPRVLYDANAAVRFVYGQNVTNLELKRKIGRQKGFNVQVRCLVPKTKTVLTANIPEEATAEWSKATGVSRIRVQVPQLLPDGGQNEQAKNHDAPFLPFRLTGIGSKTQLVVIGQKIYEELARQEFEGSFDTREMLAHMGKSPDAPNYKQISLVTDLNIGDPISLEIDQGDLHGIQRFDTTEARQHYLQMRGYAEDVAAIFAQTMGQMSTVFYTKAYRFSWSDSDGYKLHVEFLNFLELDRQGLKIA